MQIRSIGSVKIFDPNEFNLERANSAVGCSVWNKIEGA